MRFVLPGVDMLRPSAPPDAVGPPEYARSQDIANSNWTLEVSLILIDSLKEIDQVNFNFICS